MCARRYQISDDDLLSLVKKQIGRVFIWFADRVYYYLSLSEWKRFIAEDKTDMLEYIKEARDCDDFALIFKAEMSKRYAINGVGFVIGETIKPDKRKPIVHAWNILIVRRGIWNELWFLEPLNDHMAKAGKRVWLHNKYYHPTHIVF